MFIVIFVLFAYIIWEIEDISRVAVGSNPNPPLTNRLSEFNPTQACPKSIALSNQTQQ